MTELRGPSTRTVLNAAFSNFTNSHSHLIDQFGANPHSIPPPPVQPLRVVDAEADDRALRWALPYKGGLALEGDWKPNRVVIIEFPDIASIENWYRAPEYQPFIALRRSAATDVMIILEGM